MEAIAKVMTVCNMNETEAANEIKAANSMLFADPEREVSMDDLEDYCYGLGLDLDDIMENPDMLLM